MDEAEVRMPLEAYHHLLEMLGEMRESEGAHEQAVEKKHPRMDFKAKAAKAHALTRKKLGLRKKR